MTCEFPIAVRHKLSLTDMHSLFTYLHTHTPLNSNVSRELELANCSRKSLEDRW